jgi:uncharacterized protein (TIGR03118 family)
MIREDVAVSRNVCRVFGFAGVLVLVLAAASPAAAQFYKQVNLVSDISGMATVPDPLLVNPWGVSFTPTSPFWVSDAGSNTATLYAVDGVTGAVTKVPLNVSTQGPSGQVFNGSGNFVVSKSGATGPAFFIFAGLNGTLSGWNPNVPAAGSMQAILAATGTPAPVAYTGLAAGTRGSDPFLYAANNSAARIDVFDKHFAQVSVPGTFKDAGLPAGDSPFNIANIGGSLYVTYSGPTGVINVFDTDGHFVKRFASGGTLLSPWGMAVAPADFGKFSNALLVGSFNLGNPAAGPGRISAFDAATGAFLGLVADVDGAPISIDGLWTLIFGNGHNGGIRNVLYFSAGIRKQMHGLFGSLAACGGPAISSVSATPSGLWPPNHKMTPVKIGYAVSDNCDPTPVCSLSISSNEGTPADWQVVDAHDVDLMAERLGSGNGRVYTIHIDCQDKQHFSSSATVAVTVAHDHGKK